MASERHDYERIDDQQFCGHRLSDGVRCYMPASHYIHRPKGADSTPIKLIEYQTTVPCMYCGTHTPMVGTKQCNTCWEMVKLIREKPEAARKILAEVEGEKR